MRINISITKWDGKEETLKFNANNKLVNETEQFYKGMDVNQVVLKITNSIVNDNREFRNFKLVGGHA